jgi:hypothetical protein
MVEEPTVGGEEPDAHLRLADRSPRPDPEVARAVGQDLQPVALRRAPPGRRRPRERGGDLGTPRILCSRTDRGPHSRGTAR